MPNNRNRNRNRNRNNKNRNKSNNNNANKQQQKEQQLKEVAQAQEEQKEAAHDQGSAAEGAESCEHKAPTAATLTAPTQLQAEESPTLKVDELVATKSSSPKEEYKNHNEKTGNDSTVPATMVDSDVQTDVGKQFTTANSETSVILQLGKESEDRCKQSIESGEEVSSLIEAITKSESQEENIAKKVEMGTKHSKERIPKVKPETLKTTPTIIRPVGLSTKTNKEGKAKSVANTIENEKNNESPEMPLVAEANKPDTHSTTESDILEKEVKVLPNTDETSSKDSENEPKNEGTASVEAAPLETKAACETPTLVPDIPKQAKVIVHRVVRELDQTNQQKPNAEKEQKSPSLQRSARVVIHKIHLEADNSMLSGTNTGKQTTVEEVTEDVCGPSTSVDTFSPPPRYTVESPKNFTDAGRTDFDRLMRDIQIQEISESSSGEFNSIDNPPLVCEVESESELLTTSDECVSPLTPTTPTIADNTHLTKHQHEELKLKRAQKRNALESHFLPQLLSPRYLDSILEENSDLGSEYSLSRSSSANIDLDATIAAAKQAKKAIEAFPRSQLDFTRQHKPHAHQHNDSIREEPLTMTLEARIVDQLMPPEEACTRLSTELTPESQDAELVYLSSSASSSVSDLMDLELEKAAALAERTLVDLDTDASALIAKPVETSTSLSSVTSSTASSTQMADEEDSADSRESTPVNQTSSTVCEISVNSSSPAVAAPPPAAPEATALSPSTKSAAAPIQTQIFTPTIASNNEVSKLEGEKALSAALSAMAESVKNLPSTSPIENFVARNSFSLSAAHNDEQPSSSTSSVSTVSTVTENFKNMEKVREIVEASKNAFNENINESANGTRYSPPPPPVPPPPSSTQYDLESTSTPILYTPTETTTAQTTHDYTNITPNTSTPDTQHLLLKRQESTESHCSDSTQYSHCTAIQVGSPPLSSTPLTSSQLSSPQPQPDFDVSRTFSDATNRSISDPLAIKKLRLLCAETLASLPYGEDVLEELAQVAQNIGEVRAQQQSQSEKDYQMPYPLPDLPHIGDLQLTLAATASKNISPRALHVVHDPARTVAITQLPPEQSLRSSSPPPPPVPAPPCKYDAWLGVPTNANPNVLVCFSPAQRTLISEQPPSDQNKPDQLLDAHQKFVERRGYHELSSEQVRAINNEKLEEQQILKTAAIMKQLRKSLTPPPPPVPPPPVPVKSLETAAKANSANTNVTANASASAKHDAGIEDDVSSKNANETAAVQTGRNKNNDQKNSNADNNNNTHRLLEIIQHDDLNRIQTHTSIPHGQRQSSIERKETTTTTTTKSSTSSSSHENNSRQTADNEYRKQREPPALPQRTSTTTEQITEQRNQLTTNRSESSRMEQQQQLDRTNQSTFMSNDKFPASGASMHSVESELSRMFPSIGKGDIFNGERKRFSNIESCSGTVGSEFCSQLRSTQPKRYSNIETSSYESKKRVENGQVIYDHSKSSHEKNEVGDKFGVHKEANSERGSKVINIPIVKESPSSAKGFDQADTVASTPPPIPPPPVPKVVTRHAIFNDDDQKIMSALNLNTSTQTNVRNSFKESERSEHLTNINKLNASEREKVAAFKEDISSTYEEFRQRAKAAATAAAEEIVAANAKSAEAATSNSVGNSPSQKLNTTHGNHSDHEKLFKDFDDLSKQLHMELESSKAQREQREKSASLFDLSRMQSTNKQHFEELKKKRHEHMQELEREIERSMRSRQDRISMPRTINIPVQLESESGVHEIPVQLSSDFQNVDTSENYRHSRRAESMCNLSDVRPHTSTGNYGSQYYQHEDDWSRYANDLGYSENIARPFAREVEICYQRQRQPNTIRAPRLSVSTNDLSTTSHHSYDAHNAYGTRRTHAPMLSQVPQQQRPRYSSCYSMIERNPNPTYISTTSRRGVSPAPPAQRAPVTPEGVGAPPPPPPEYERRERRASLPRELHEKQLKYISSKEEELKMEFERLQNERRRLMEEMNRATGVPLPTPTQPRRDSYRQAAPKLPTLTEDEVFRQQMAEEWLNKVAEREERRLQKIIKISKVHEDEQADAAVKSNISDEFLNRVKERRTKLSMPADSDWESGAESQPYAQGQASESDAELPPVKVIEGKSEANLRQLPRHLREFAKFSNNETQQIDGGHRELHHEEESRQEATDNSLSSATKKSSIVKTFKVSRLPPSVQQQPQNPHQQEQQTNGSNPALSTRGRRQPTQLQHLQNHQNREPIIYVNGKLSNESSQGQQHQTKDQKHQQEKSHVKVNSKSSIAVTLRHGKGTGASAASRKQTRFLLTASQHQQQLLQRRRSWSESDLLKEIDNELQLAKGFLFADVMIVEPPPLSSPSHTRPSRSSLSSAVCEPTQTAAMFAPKFKAKAPPGTGVWTPKNQTPHASNSDLECIPTVSVQRGGTPSNLQTPTPPLPPTQPIWTPQPSPTSRRQEFRPVHFESPSLPRRYTALQQSQHTQSLSSQLPPPWSSASHSPRSVNSCTNLSTPTTANSDYADTDYSTATTAIYAPSKSVLDKIRTFERSASTSDLQQPFLRRQLSDISRPAYRPNEVIYKVKSEYMSEPETETDRPRKMAQLSRRQYDGIGPVTNDGMPIILRSEVKEPHQHEWYKRLYQTIHKQKNGDEFVIRYKCPRARPPYKASGYQSEPEPNYDSDYSTVRYKTYNPHRLQSVSSAINVRTGANFGQEDTVYGSMPNPIKSGQTSYKNQPGRIEDYVTGHSSVSEKEKKEWWDEVMDIFNGWLREHAAVPRICITYASDVEDCYHHLEQSKLSPHYTEGNLSRALAKESGYTSDSNLVFRKREVPNSSPLSPVEQKQAYKSLQAGGEPPLFGFRKPAPEKPRDFIEEVEFIQITPTLTKIRVSTKEINNIEANEASETQERNIQIKNKENKEEIVMFSQFSKHLPSFIPLSQQQKKQHEPAPPPLPNRKSSCTKTTARVSTAGKTPPVHRHEQCFQSPDTVPLGASKYGTITLRKHSHRETPICRSKSAGTVSTLVATLTSTAKESRNKDDCLARLHQRQHHARLRSLSPSRRQARVLTLRQSSRSPVAFGRSISKERTFAEEKKRLENTLPPNRTNFEASTNILRDPLLKSPQDVKAAVRSYATCNVHARSKSLPRLRHASKINGYTTVNTTMRHTMCFPQVQPQNGGALEHSKFVQKTSNNTLPKTRHNQKTTLKTNVHRSDSNESLPHSNSTFSIDSMVQHEITTTTPNRPVKAVVVTKSKNSRAAPLQNSKSDSNLGRKRLSITKKPITKLSQQTMSKPVTYTSKTYLESSLPRPAPDSYSESVREKTNFWNDFNAQQTKSLTLQPTSYKYCSLRSISPTRQELRAAEQFSDDLYECGAMAQEPNCIEDLVWKYEHNSKPEVISKAPATVTVSVTDIARPQSPQPDYENSRRFSPTREVRIPQTPRNVRSPSRRRIDSYRTLLKSDGDTAKVIRASSLSSADDRSKRGLYLCGDLAHSATSLTYLERHSPTCRYRNNSERFTDLNRFYSTLERVGQLERATSVTNFKPIRKDTELLNFDEWRKVRLHERAEKELNYLVCKLKQDQRENDMIFRLKDVEDVKWHKETDIGLHSKEKSVEDLRDNFEQIKLLQDHEQHRNYYSYLRRNTVAELGTNFGVKHNDDGDKPNGHLSNDLVSTLSKDQIKKISQQLNEIYATNRKESTQYQNPAVSEEYVVTVTRDAKPNQHANTLKVRCNSTITKDELLGPVLRKKDSKNSAASLGHRNTQSEDQLESNVVGKPTRSISPVICGRETRGAIAAKNAEITLSKPPEVPPRPKADFKSRKERSPEVKRDIKKPEEQEVNESVSLNASHEKSDNISQKIQYFEERQFDEPPKTIYHAREESSPDEDEVMRLIEENIKARAQDSYSHKQTQQQLLHQHKELSNSLTNMEEIFGERHISRVNFHLGAPHQRPPDHKTDQLTQTLVSFDLDAGSPGCSSVEFCDSYYRSRSLSPQSQTSSSYLQRVYTGEVQKMKEKFESIGQQHSNEQHDFFGLSSLRKARSDPEINSPLETGSKDALNQASASTNGDNRPDVPWITHKFELRSHHSKLSSDNDRSRRRQRGAISPSLLRNRLMPHIDIISKTAALKQELAKKPPMKQQSPTRSHSSNSGIVDRIRSRYELSESKHNQYFSTSDPELHDVRDISPHLSADWIAHKFPNPKQNSLLQHDTQIEHRRQVRKPKRLQRSSSTSPPRPPKSHRHVATTELTHTLCPYYDDIFANQEFDPKIHQPKSRYVPEGAENVNTNSDVSKLPSNVAGTIDRLKKSMAVTFKDYDSSAPPTPPQLPIKGVSFEQYDNGSESPIRYYDTDVNIHFKAPMRHEYKQNISEEELATRQAEHMQKLYQEGRRRKYLQELQDMNSRRHTDNFTPSQKSPIALNRYDDFPTDVTLKTLIGPKTVARALYNFQGQTSKELSFRKGDIIYIRRQIDSNWYEGEYNAMIGLLPVSYVEIVSRDGARPQARRPSEGQARAKYNFQAQSGIELSLNKGELVTLTRRVDDNWFEGKIANRKGIFPVSYVEVLTDIGAEDIAARTTIINSHSTTNLRPSLDSLRTNINNEFNTLTQNGTHAPNGILKETRQKTDALHVDTSSEPLAYRALYKYRPQNSDELELHEGDFVHVLEKCDDGWFVGTSQRTGCFGTFPGNYVERV